MYHPWRRMRQMQNIDIVWTEQPAGRLAATDGQSVIYMDPRQGQAQRRCSIAHEAAHIELGHVGGCSGAEETQAARLAARRLIPVRRLADALVWSQHPEDVADALWVDVDTLMTRLAHLHPAERHYISQRLAARDDGA